MSTELEHNVRQFHEKFGHPVARLPVWGTSEDVLKFRIKMIREESNELIEAIEQKDMAKIAAEAVDLIYVVIGTLVVMGLPLMPFWREVQRANMQKEVNPEGGKPIKPAGWQEPDAVKVLHKVRTRDV